MLLHNRVFYLISHSPRAYKTSTPESHVGKGKNLLGRTPFAQKDTLKPHEKT